jgi:hypothetical protein
MSTNSNHFAQARKTPTSIDSTHLTVNRSAAQSVRGSFETLWGGKSTKFVALAGGTLRHREKNPRIAHPESVDRSGPF